MPRKAKGEGTPGRPQMTVVFASDEDLQEFKEIARRKRMPPTILARLVLGEYIDNERATSRERRP